MQTVYIETSIVSYLRMRTASNVVAAARQLLTRQWWDHEREKYRLVISQYVLDEAAKGNPTLAAERLKHLDGIPMLAIESGVRDIADSILLSAVLPVKAEFDALHVAVAAYHGVDYLLTWNCTHIANARTLPKIQKVLSKIGYPSPTVCTPEEMVDYEIDLQE
jgi:hypothetical protein